MRSTRTLAILLMAFALFATACASDAEDPVADAGTPGGDTDTATQDATADTEAPEDADAGSDDDAGSNDDGGSVDLAGAGASFPDPVYQTWIGTYTQEIDPSVTINYNAIGSGGGREAFIAQEVDFAGSDAFMGDEDIAAAIEARGGGDVLHIPMVFGGVVVAYNIEGLDDLVLDAATISGIFRGEITNVNDPAIAELNPDADLPDQELTVVHRSDGSGTTSIFTTWLEDEDQAWADEVGSGSEVEWPTGLGGDQNQGVQQTLSQQPGGIGYLSLEFAVEAGLPFARVVNADGNAVEATTETVSAAADSLSEVPEDLRFNLLGIGGDAYPIAGATWVLAATTGMDEAKAEALRAYLTWALEEGDADASALGYAPLGEEMQQRALEKVEQINADA